MEEEKMKAEKKTKYRPIELVHDFGFIPCSFPQDLALPSPRERMKRLKSLGYGGIAISPSYADYLSENSLEETCDLIRYANELGLRVWIYDEKFYPSGSAAGTVPRENPALEAKAAAMFCKEPDEKGVIYMNSPHGYGDVMAAYICELDDRGNPDFGTLTDVMAYKSFGGGIVFDCRGRSNLRLFAFFGRSAFEFCTTSHNTRGVRRYIDTLRKDASDAFMQKTYEGYRDLGNPGDYIEAVFTDEPQIPGLCRQNYRRDYLDYVTAQQSDVFRIYDIPDPAVAFAPYIPWTEELPGAFLAEHGYDLMPALPRLFADESESGRKIRADFWQTVSTLFRDNFGENYAEFCRKIGVLYSGHFLGEEKISWHPYMHGDLLAQLGTMDIPGCDLLCASPGKILESASSIKFASSAAQLYGKTDVMIEASNISRDIFPITKEAYMLATAMEAAMGVTSFLSYYTDFCMGDDDLRACCDFTEHLLSVLDGMEPVRKVYVYVPNRDYWSESYPAYSISAKKDFTEKMKETDNYTVHAAEMLCRANIDFNFISDDCLSTLKADKDSILLVPPSASVPETAAFGKIIMENTLDAAVSVLLQMNCATVSADNDAALISLHKRSETAEAFLLVNTSKDFRGTVAYNTSRAFTNARIYNPHDNAYSKMSRIMEIPAGECRIVIFSADTPPHESK